MAPYETIRLITAAGLPALPEAHVDAFRRYIAARGEVGLELATGASEDPGRLNLVLRVDETIGAQGFRIESGTAANCIEIAGNDVLGLFYGVGKVLRACRFDERGVTAGAAPGTFVPQCPVRGMFFASHMRNFYEAAPMEKIRTYLEELALWGLNSILLHCYYGLDEEHNREVLAKYRTVLQTGVDLGLSVGFIIEPNIATGLEVPEAVRNTPYPDDWRKRGDAGVKVCASNPEGRALLLEHWRGLLEELKDIRMDYVGFFPYDAGGCGCEQCWPWGSRGFIELSREWAGVAKEHWPSAEIMLATWMFDMPPAGEWEGLTSELKREPSWVSYIVCDDDEDFPEYPLRPGVLGSARLLNFSEITMWGMWPWGGYGANPLPQRLHRLWGQVKETVAGGFPYSEGIYDDLNKVLVLQLYWNREAAPEDILTEYIASEFSADAVPPVLQALDCLEANSTARWQGEPAYPDAYDHLEKAEARLTAQARDAWRWRILVLRAKLDRERFLATVRTLGDEWPTAACAPMLRELTEIYHADEADGPVRPPLDRVQGTKLAVPAPETALRG